MKRGDQWIQDHINLHNGTIFKEDHTNLRNGITNHLDRFSRHSGMVLSSYIIHLNSCTMILSDRKCLLCNLRDLAENLSTTEPSCTVGITGTAATITFQGWQANSDCMQILSGQGSNGSNIGSAYQLDQPLDEPVVCEMNKDDLHITVRDEGILKIVGNILCQRLMSS